LLSFSLSWIRLGGFSNLKKDGTSHAGKLVQPVLKLLNDESSEAIWVRSINFREHLDIIILGLYRSKKKKKKLFWVCGCF
jgi:hypothetical protein